MWRLSQSLYHSFLRRHKAVHTEEKTYKCEEYGRWFSFSSALRWHRTIHCEAVPASVGNVADPFLHCLLLQNTSLFILSKNQKKQKRKHGNVMDVKEPSPLTVTSYSSSYWRETPQMWRVAKCFTLEFKFQNIHTGQKPYKYEECLLASLYPCVPSNYFEMLTIYYPQAQML